MEVWYPIFILERKTSFWICKVLIPPWLRVTITLVWIDHNLHGTTFTHPIRNTKAFLKGQVAECFVHFCTFYPYWLQDIALYLGKSRNSPYTLFKSKKSSQWKYHTPLISICIHTREAKLVILDKICRHPWFHWSNSS